MVTRISTYAGPAGRLDDFVRGLQQNMWALREFSGFAGAYMLVDRETGDAITLTFWDSPEAEVATAQQADKWRQEAARSTEHSVESVVVLEVAVEVTPSGSGPDVEGAVV
jgi:heme-degrading monooxygenase HmoA